MMGALNLSLKRNQSGTIDSYGSEFNSRLDQLVGGSTKWDTRTSHGVARLGRTKAKVERHETGPEILQLVTAQLPAYVSTICALIALWRSRPGSRKEAPNTIKIDLDGHKYEAPLNSGKDVQRAQQVLRALAKK